MTAITIPNTFVPSTTISSTAMNANFTAVSDAIEASLALDGSESMTGQIRAAAGSAAAPGLAFSNDLDTGVYRHGANALGFATGGTLAAHIDSAQKLSLAGALDVTGALTGGIAPSTELTDPAVLDELLINDVSAPGNRKITLANLLKVVSLLTGETTPAADDLLMLYDLSETAANSITLADFFKTINVLTAETAVDTEADLIAIYDASASAARKVLAKNFPGRIVQRFYVSASSFSTTSIIPTDGSIPQITEGAEILSQVITPKSATNRIRCRFTGTFGNSGGSGGRVSGALFNGGANALNCGACWMGDNGPGNAIVIEYEEVAGGVSPITYSVRVGPNGSTGVLGAGQGNTLATLVIEEIVP